MKLIPLTRGMFAKVDDGDFERVSQFRWHASKGTGDIWYAKRNFCDARGRYRSIRMHAFIMQSPPGMDVDHRNRDGLDNTRTNLRVVTRSVNLQGRKKSAGRTSRFIGVSRHSGGKWDARLGRYIGLFASEIEAAAAYNQAAIAKYGPDARLNVL